jgi:hypothetical protein
VAPRKLAALFEPWMWLLRDAAGAAVAAFCERQPEPSLEEFQVCMTRACRRVSVSVSMFAGACACVA